MYKYVQYIVLAVTESTPTFERMNRWKDNKQKESFLTTTGEAHGSQYVLYMYKYL